MMSTKLVVIFSLFFSIVVIVLVQTSVVRADGSTVASQFKAPNKSTPANIANEWNSKDEALWSYVKANVPAVLDHTGSSSFDEHLRGVQAVLRHFGAPDHLPSAGLFHSIYGTEG